MTRFQQKIGSLMKFEGSEGDAGSAFFLPLRRSSQLGADARSTSRSVIVPSPTHSTETLVKPAALDIEP